MNPDQQAAVLRMVNRYNGDAPPKEIWNQAIEVVRLEVLNRHTCNSPICYTRPLKDRLAELGR